MNVMPFNFHSRTAFNTITGKFWRVPTWKFYAIKRLDRECKGKGKGKKRSSHIVVGSSSDTDDFLPHINVTKKRRVGDESSSENLSIIKDDIHALREDMQRLFQIEKRMKFPAALYNKLSVTFKCSICQLSPIIPPVIFARCCKSIVGCQVCVDTWYRGEDGISKKCPLCGVDRALPETMRLHGLDDFLQSIQPILTEPQATCDNESNTTPE